MADQNVMKIHLADSTTVGVGDIVQCPCCCEKFVVMPGMVLDVYWDAQTQGPQPKDFEDRDYVVCPNCEKITDVEYYVAAYAAGVELPPIPKPKEVKPDGQPGSRKGVSKQRTRVKDGDQAHPKKTRSPRSKST